MSVNKVILVGRIGNDPEVRNTQNGSVITNASIATKETWKDKQSGQKQERIEWVNLVFFNKIAETARDYVKKGMLIYVEGKLRTEKWKDKQGIDRYTTKVYVEKMSFLASSNNQQNQGQQQYNQQGQQYQQPAQPYQQNQQYSGQYQQPAQQPQPNQQQNNLAGFDEDIPF